MLLTFWENVGKPHLRSIRNTFLSLARWIDPFVRQECCWWMILQKPEFISCVAFNNICLLQQFGEGLEEICQWKSPVQVRVRVKVSPSVWLLTVFITALFFYTLLGCVLTLSQMCVLTQGSVAFHLVACDHHQRSKFSPYATQTSFSVYSPLVLIPVFDLSSL